jgi:hypothetical protein
LQFPAPCRLGGKNWRRLLYLPRPNLRIPRGYAQAEPSCWSKENSCRTNDPTCHATCPLPCGGRRNNAGNRAFSVVSMLGGFHDRQFQK